MPTWLIVLLAIVGLVLFAFLAVLVYMVAQFSPTDVQDNIEGPYDYGTDTKDSDKAD